MTRHGRRLNKAEMEAYWLALNDQLEREVLEPPPAKELVSRIEKLEDLVGDERSGLAFEIATGRA